MTVTMTAAAVETVDTPTGDEAAAQTIPGPRTGNDSTTKRRARRVAERATDDGDTTDTEGTGATTDSGALSPGAAAAVAEDLDAQSPAADLVRVYLNGIGKRALLTAAPWCHGASDLGWSRTRP